MIKLKITPDAQSPFNDAEKEVEITPTFFPDGTGQVWKLPTNIKNAVQFAYFTEVIWIFENEAELIHVCQLAQLIAKLSNRHIRASLFIPYLPYGRRIKRLVTMNVSRKQLSGLSF